MFPPCRSEIRYAIIQLMRPKLMIKHGKLLEPFFKVYIEQKYPDFVFPTEEAVQEKVVLFRKAWSEYEDKFFSGIESLGLEFKRNYIEVYVVAAINRDMSAPLVIRSRYDEKEFISILFHELLHNLFNDVRIVKAYEDESDQTRNHIYVFAMMEYLFRDILNEPERIDIEKSHSGPDKNVEYYMAWQIVENDGYRAILEGIVFAK